MFKKFFEISLDLLCIVNDEYFLKVNPAFTKTLGYSIDELTSNSYFDLIHPSDIEESRDIFQKLLNGIDVSHFENRYKHKDGHYIILSWSAVLNLEDNLVYAVARDVTSLKHKESMLCLLYTSPSPRD